MKKTLIVCPGKIKTNISLNAVTDKGKHGKMDESHFDAMSAEECAQIILKAVIKGEEEILVGGRELKGVTLRRFFPKLFGKIIRKQGPF